MLETLVSSRLCASPPIVGYKIYVLPVAQVLELLGEMAEVSLDPSVRDGLGKWAMGACHDDFNIPHPGLVR